MTRPERPSDRLLIHIIASTAVKGDESPAFNVLRKFKSKEIFNKLITDSKELLSGFIAEVRASEDANPNWTDDDICQMIIDKIVEKDPSLKDRLQ